MADMQDCQLSCRGMVIHLSGGTLTKPDISQTEANSATKKKSFSTATRSLYIQILFGNLVFNERSKTETLISWQDL